jgi:hypothetical protein
VWDFFERSRFIIDVFASLLERNIALPTSVWTGEIGEAARSLSIRSLSGSWLSSGSVTARAEVSGQVLVAYEEGADRSV